VVAISRRDKARPDAKTQRKICKDAGQDAAHRKRPAPHPGPRCASCNRMVQNPRADARHEAYVIKTYELLPGEYQAILKEQNGKCKICPAPLKYTKRRYAVDHDHAKEKILGMRLSIRGLLCKRHNNLLRDVRDSVETLQSAIDYLLDPPAHNIIERENE